MNESNQCQRCGGPLPKDGVLGGRCLRCMFELGLETSPDLAKDTLGIEKLPGVGTPVTIGRYRILRVIGEGGMGVVYEAEQDQPRRTVALKIIKPGLVSDQLIRRFEQESQALGRLQHPGIAQIYEAGTVDTGFGPQPYFAMELIHGRSPRDHAELQHLDTSQRVEIMVKICIAVHHAHQRGLIHRDLKPGNILVDETGQPKILDFGVARVTDSDTRTTLQTDIGQLIGTLAYMSPEQALADPLDIDTRSDVYTLGVILYELLTGRLPYTISKKLHEAIHAIREEDPVRLSAVNRAYRGDIETIVGKALEKDRTMRYASAAGMAADLQRYLKDEPIAARPPSSSYQLRKFMRRHKALMSGVAAVFAVLVAAIVVSRAEMIRAQHAERAAVLEKNRAEGAERTATAAEAQARQDRDTAFAEQQRADTEAARTKDLRLMTIWQSLARESVRQSANRIDDERAALLARQAMLIHSRTSNQAYYLVEDALQLAVRLTPWSRNLQGHQGTVNAVAFSPDGSRLASASSDQTVLIWDLRTPGVSPVILKGHDGPVFTVAFSPDSTRIASGGLDHIVRIWDVGAPGAHPLLLKAHDGVVNSVAFSRDGTRLASGGQDGTVRIWNIRDGGAVSLLIRDAGIVRSLAFSPDGLHLASGSQDGLVRIWDLGNLTARGVEFVPLQSHTGPVFAVAFSPDGARLASAGMAIGEGGVRSEGRGNGRGGGDGRGGRAGALGGRAGQVASTTPPDHSVRIWDLRNPGSLPRLLSDHLENVNSVAFSPDGAHLATASADKTVRIWDLRDPNAKAVVLQSNEGAVISVAFSPDGARLASTGSEHSVRLWDLRNPDVSVLLRDNPNPPEFLTFSRNGRQLFFYAGPTGIPSLRATNDSNVKVWDPHNPSASPVLFKVPEDANGGSRALSPDGARVASTGNNMVRIWNLRSPGSAPVVLLAQRPVTLAFSRDGTQLASGSIDGSILVWNLLIPGAAPILLAGDGVRIGSLEFSPDGSQLAGTGPDFIIRVWNLSKPSAAPTAFRGHQQNITSLAFSPDGAHLASGSFDLSVRVWDLHHPGATPVILQGDGGVIDSVSFSPNGLRLVSGSRDGSLRVWDLHHPSSPPTLLQGHEGAVRLVAFAPDSVHLASAGTDGTVRLWSIWSAMADYLCTRVSRNLSPNEWLQYVGEGIPYERTCPALPLGVGASASPQ